MNTIIHNLFVSIILFCFFEYNIGDYSGSGIDKNCYEVPDTGFKCYDYRSCYTNFEYIINYDDVEYVCFMPERIKFMSGFKNDGYFESIGMNYDCKSLNETYINSNSFVRIFDLQLLNFYNYKIDRVCIKY